MHSRQHRVALRQFSFITIRYIILGSRVLKVRSGNYFLVVFISAIYHFSTSCMVVLSTYISTYGLVVVGKRMSFDLL